MTEKQNNVTSDEQLNDGVDDLNSTVAFALQRNFAVFIAVAQD